MSFELLRTETIFTGRVFSVERVFVRMPDGSERHYELVRHSGAITIVPVDAEGHLYFVRQYRLGAGGDLLELPAGMLEPGEDALEGAAREIREEIGLAAGRIDKIGALFLAPGYSSEFMHVFLATDLRDDPLTADEDEFLQVEKLHYKEAYQQAERGELKDGKTLAALLLARPHIEALFG